MSFLFWPLVRFGAVAQAFSEYCTNLKGKNTFMSSDGFFFF